MQMFLCEANWAQSKLDFLYFCQGSLLRDYKS